MQKPSLLKPALLKLVAYEHPILKKKIAPLQFPLTEEDKQIIANMKFSIMPEQLKAAGAPWDAAVGMAANQWGLDKRIFLYAPEGVEGGIEVIINPSYKPLEEESLELSSNEEENWEGCFSVPSASGRMKRYTNIQVSYQNEQGNVITKTLKDWQARVFQHETDHLDGFLYDDPRTGRCLEKKVFSKAELDEMRRERMENKNV